MDWVQNSCACTFRSKYFIQLKAILRSKLSIDIYFLSKTRLPHCKFIMHLLLTTLLKFTGEHLLASMLVRGLGSNPSREILLQMWIYCNSMEDFEMLKWINIFPINWWNTLNCTWMINLIFSLVKCLPMVHMYSGMKWTKTQHLMEMCNVVCM